MQVAGLIPTVHKHDRARESFALNEPCEQLSFFFVANQPELLIYRVSGNLIRFDFDMFGF